RGRRECRVLAAPAASFAKTKQANEHSHYRSAEYSGTPCAMVERLLRALPGVPGLLAPVALPIIPARLGTSVGVPGPHGLTVRLGAHRPRTESVHRIPPHVSRRLAERPSWRDGISSFYHNSAFRKDKYFCGPRLTRRPKQAACFRCFARRVEFAT